MASGFGKGEPPSKQQEAGQSPPPVPSGIKLVPPANHRTPACRLNQLPLLVNRDRSMALAIAW